jgi:hypothetical protein
MQYWCPIRHATRVRRRTRIIASSSMTATPRDRQRLPVRRDELQAKRSGSDSLWREGLVEPGMVAAGDHVSALLPPQRGNSPVASRLFFMYR